MIGEKDLEVEESGIDVETLKGLLDSSNTMPPIELDMDEFDIEEFEKGIKEISFLCGKITALFNVGVSENFILEYLVGQDLLANNLKLTESNNETQVAVAKSQAVLLEKSTV